MNLDDHVCQCNESCIISSKNSSFIVYGAKTSYRLNNNGKFVSKYIVDDCVLKQFNEHKKCDYLFIVQKSRTKKDKKDGYFIELKGGDVPKAINQLLNSINHLRNNINGEILGRIVCSKFPKAPDTLSSNSYIKLRKVLKGNIIIKSTQFFENA